jgi:glycosyltransferase involved in cell wall biosynthesis
VVPNGIEPGEFALDRSAAREQVWERLPQLERRPYVLFLGRLHSKKRLDVLLEAFLAGAPEPYRLVVAGPDEQGLWPGFAQRFLTTSHAARRVVYTGCVVGADKATLLAGAELFALPSEHENFGIAALEALAARTPTLLSPQVDLANAVESAGFGFTAPVNAAAWGRQFAGLLAQPERLQALAVPARAWACERFSWGRIADEILRQYQRVVRGRFSLPEPACNAVVAASQLPDLHAERGSQPAALPGQPRLV